MSVRLITLGPAGSNHELVARRYAAYHGRTDAAIDLVLDFHDAAEAVLAGRAGYMLQAAAHPQTAEIIGRYLNRLFVADTFIAPSKPMALLAREGVSRPRTLALQPATRSYVDVTQWQEVIEEQSTVSVGAGLLDGRYDAGIALLELHDANPGVFRVVQSIGTVDDAWLVYTRQRTCTDGILAWRDSPVGRALRSP
jgi:hypothetical protein